MHKVTIKKNRLLATEMECCIVWDPTRPSGPTFDLGSYPCVPAAARDARFEEQAEDARKRGCWETLMRIGEVLEGAGSIKHVIADAHGSHSMASNWIHGLMDRVGLPDDLKRLVPWFKSLRHQDLPACCFPLPIRIGFQGEDPVFFWPGAAHSQKKLCGSVTKPPCQYPLRPVVCRPVSLLRARSLCLCLRWCRCNVRPTGGHVVSWICFALLN